MSDVAGIFGDPTAFRPITKYYTGEPNSSRFFGPGVHRSYFDPFAHAGVDEEVLEALNAGIKAAVVAMEDGSISEERYQRIVKMLIAGCISEVFQRGAFVYVAGLADEVLSRTIRELDSIVERTAESAGAGVTGERG